MKVTVVLAALAASCASFTAAQDLSSIPACVLTCVQQAAGTAGCTGLTDTTCICTNAGFQSAAQSCLASNCTPAEQQAALTLQNALCAGTSASGSVTSAIDSTIASAAATQSTDIASLTSALSTAAPSSVSSAVSQATASGSSAASGVTGAVSSAVQSASAAASSARSAASSAIAGVSSGAGSVASAATSRASGAASSAPASGAMSAFDSSNIKIAGLVGLAVMGGMVVMA